MKPPDLLKMNKPPCILVYSPAGGGKTGLAAQLKDAYIFDFDDGMRTAATLKDKFFDIRQKIDFDIYKDPNPMKPKMFPLAIKKLQEIVRKSAEGKWDKNGLVVDSLTGACRAAQLYNQFTAGQDSFKKMEIQNWGTLINEIEKFLTLVRSVGVPTIVTAHVDMLDAPMMNAYGKPILGQRKVTAQFPSSATTKHGFRKLMWLFDEVLYAERKPIGGGKEKFTVTGNKVGSVIQTRTRSGIDIVRHDEIGLEGLLNLMGYHYEK